jgi:hypothetical protein
MPCRDTPPPARWAAASAWAMKGLTRWLREERMRPGRGWKSFSSAIADPGNVRKSQFRQSVAGQAHLAPQGRTLLDRQNIPIKTTDRPSRTLRPFISPSVGWFLRSSLACPSFFPEERCAAPAYEIAPESCDVAAGNVGSRRADRESAS